MTLGRILEYLSKVVRGLENSIHPDEWNADDTDCADNHGFGVSPSDISFLSFETIALLKSGYLPKLNKRILYPNMTFNSFISGSFIPSLYP